MDVPVETVLLNEVRSEGHLKKRVRVGGDGPSQWERKEKATSSPYPLKGLY